MNVFRGGPFVMKGRGFANFFRTMTSNMIPALSALGRRIFAHPVTHTLARRVADKVIEVGIKKLEGDSQNKAHSLSMQNSLANAKKRITGVLDKEVKRRKKGIAKEGALAPLIDAEKKRQKRGALGVLAKKGRARKRLKTVFDSSEESTD